jgi:FAD/FMN-containing dehydrogenase
MPSPRFRDTGRYVQRPATAKTLKPGNLAELMRCLDPASQAALPIRIRGAGTAATDCNTNESGTIIDMTALDSVVGIDAHNLTVTVQAGVRLGSLVEALAKHGLELAANHDQPERTVGGAIASPCMGPGIGKRPSFLSSEAVSVKLVTPDGRFMKVSRQQKHLLHALRLSYGMLGAIYEVTLRVRAIATFSASHRGLDLDTFADVIDRLAARDLGLKFYLLPHKNRVYLDLRRYEASPGSAHRVAWKIKDWGESTVLPHVFKSLNRIVPIPSVRYRLMDRLSTATHDLVNSRFVTRGTNVTASGRRRREPRDLLYSTWCFPASDFAIVIKAYRDFCRETLESSGYRTDLPAVGFRVAQDRSAVLSPSFDEPMVALNVVSTQRKGWEDFVIDLGHFAENWGGTPLFSHSRALRAEYARDFYDERLAFFRRLRDQLDPHGRLLNPFMSQCFR